MKVFQAMDELEELLMALLFTMLHLSTMPQLLPMPLSLLTMPPLLLMLHWLPIMVLFLVATEVLAKCLTNLSPSHTRENTEAPHSPRLLELELLPLLTLLTVFMVPGDLSLMDLVMELSSMVKGFPMCKLFLLRYGLCIIISIRLFGNRDIK